MVLHPRSFWRWVQLPVPRPRDGRVLFGMPWTCWACLLICFLFCSMFPASERMALMTQDTYIATAFYMMRLHCNGIAWDGQQKRTHGPARKQPYACHYLFCCRYLFFLSLFSRLPSSLTRLSTRNEEKRFSYRLLQNGNFVI